MRIYLALLAALIPATAASQTRPTAWRLMTYPNAGLLVEQAQGDGVYALRQSLNCTPGDPVVVWRRYYPAQTTVPPGARRGCDVQCRTEAVVSEADARRPAGFSERRLPWPEVKRLLQSEAARQTVAERRSNPGSESLARHIPPFAKACRLPDPPGPVRTDPLRQDASSARGWTDFQPGWRLLPTGEPAPVAQQDFSVPSSADSPGALSEVIAAKDSAIIRLEVEGLSGRVGVLLVSPEADRQISGEKAIAEGERGMVHLRLKAGTRGRLLLRNAHNPGAPGSVRLNSVAVSAESALPADVAARLAPEIR